MKKLSVLSAIALTIAAAGMVLVGPAFGHANLIVSNVKNGQVFSLSDAPGQVKLKFSEQLDKKRSTIYVIKVGEETIVDKDDLFTSEDEMSISISVLQTGVYQVRWIAVTADDEGFIDGVITFSVKL